MSPFPTNSSTLTKPCLRQRRGENLAVNSVHSHQNLRLVEITLSVSTPIVPIAVTNLTYITEAIVAARPVGDRKLKRFVSLARITEVRIIESNMDISDIQNSGVSRYILHSLRLTGYKWEGYPGEDT